MRKIWISALMMTLALLTGCAGRANRLEQDFSVFREQLRSAEALECAVSLCWNSGESLSEYGLELSAGDDSCRVTVTEPELIAGISAVIGEEGAALEYESVMLGVGELAGLTPVSALPELLRSMAYGYAELFWREDDYLAVRLWMDEEAVAELWLLDGRPVCAEIAADGVTLATCSFENWTITEQER